METQHIIVVGGGLAGIVCSLELLDAGCYVTLLDRDTPDNLGGLAKESFGGILLVDTPEQRRQKVQDSVDLALQDWLAFGEIDANAHLDPQHPQHWPRRWAEHYLQDSGQYVYQWLKQRGIGFLPMPLWVERGMGTGSKGALRGNSVPRWHVVWGTGHELASQLAKRLLAHPQRKRLTLKFGHKVSDLIISNGHAQGCHGIVESTQAAFEVMGDCVVIAAGGINGGNLEQVRQHWHADWGATPPNSLLNGSHRFADGTLHQAARHAGANITHLENQWNYAGGIAHWRPRKAKHGLSLVPPKSALWLNAAGERISPALVSGFDTRDLVTQVCAQPQGYSWQLMNRTIALKELAISGAEFNPSIRNKSWVGFVRDLLLGNRWLVNDVLDNSADVVTANTLEELASKMNALQGHASIDAQRLTQTVAAYDAEVAKGLASTDSQRQRIAQLRQWKGDRLRTCKAARIVDGSLLIAVREHIISRKSLGGIQTDLHSRVLQANGQAISGLYAIGEAAGFGGGGMNGLRGLEGTFLGGCFYSAQKAAHHIQTGAA